MVISSNKINFLQIFFLHIKMTNNYYQKHKERLQKEVFLKKQKIKSKESPEKDIKVLLKKKKEKNRQYHRERNINFSKEQKQRLLEYIKNCYITHNK